MELHTNYLNTDIQIPLFAQMACCMIIWSCFNFRKPQISVAYLVRVHHAILRSLAQTNSLMDLGREGLGAFAYINFNLYRFEDLLIN